MQAMNLHPAQQDILLNLLNILPGKAQGMSKMPQDEMSFSSMLERADKTYSTEGKNTQKPQDASPKAEASSLKKNEPRDDSSVHSEKTDEHAGKSEKEVVRDDAKPEEKTAFDIDNADTEIEKVTLKTESALSEEMVKAGEMAENECLTMPDAEEIAAVDNDAVNVQENINSSINGIQNADDDALALENAQTADKNALASRLESKPVIQTASIAETAVADNAKSDDEVKEVTSDRKTKKKDILQDGKEAAELVKADNPAANAEQKIPEADSATLAAIQTKTDISNDQKSKIEVIDERTHAESSEITLNTTTSISNDGSSAEMVMTLPVQAAGSEANGSLEAGYSKADFSQMLNNSIAATKDEFVKTGSIILQDNKKGSINLILRPEELGNVKVKLELSDNQITGKIVVASKEAFEAFKANLEDIRNAFVANGFDACGFDLAWAGAGDSNGSQGQNAADNGSQNQFGLQYYGTAYEDDIPDSVPEYYADNTHINLVA